MKSTWNHHYKNSIKILKLLLQRVPSKRYEPASYKPELKYLSYPTDKNIIEAINKNRDFLI